MSLKILVVDDASFTRDLIRRTLRKQFPAVEIEEAVNGRKAQQMLTKTQFDIVLCDWEMPEMTGVELLKWCREQPKYKKEDVPFVMITSRGDKSHVVEAVQSGVTDYLGKPFSSEQLANKVISAAKKHGLDKKLTSQKSRESASPGGVSTASLDVLMGAGKSAPVKATKFTNPDAPVVSVKDVKIPTIVRFEGKQFRCMVIQFSKTEATMFIKSDDVVPQVLGQAVLDLEHKGVTNRLNYYVQSVATTEKKHDSTFLTVILSLIDQDSEKEAFISQLFESL
ncbi:MAG: response regulator [Marinomonas foliarum]|jgi:CheY-like chemotaxis protein|uniref:Response regulator n=1 Tax=Marinomonas foliarum TaxID=491950 RepID=A0A369ABN1_9GAMM|nr:response regulator [Marinomonas foliarum]QRV25604.1 response regulator [Marinomonas foliarum]RCX06760.1 response regulator receiver domain-containing protein [Marinomonas foliarum]